MKKFIAGILMVSMLVAFGGCAWLCSNAPSIATKLSSTVEVLKGLTDQLGSALLSGYDAEIELAYIAAKASLAAAQTLLDQTCPDTKAVTAVVDGADKVSIPQSNAAVMKAKKMKMIK